MNPSKKFSWYKSMMAKLEHELRLKGSERDNNSSEKREDKKESKEG